MDCAFLFKKILLAALAFVLPFSAFGEVKKGVHSKIPLNEASIEDIDSENFPDLIKSFDYPKAQITDVVMAMSHLTGINFIIDPNVKGTISIIAPSPITVAEAFQAFLSALAVSGYALVRSGAFWKVISAESASQDNLQVYKGEYFPSADQYITKVFKLKHAHVKNLEKHLKQFLTKDKHKVMFYEQANTIIVSDYGSAIEKISQIIKELDVPDVHTIVEVVPIRYATASDLSLKLQTLLTSKSGRTGGRSFTGSTRNVGARLISPKEVGSTGISALIPDERTNSIIISGSKKGIAKAKKLISKLDFYIDPQTAGGIYVYYVKHGKAVDIEKTLNNILKSESSSGKGSARSNIRSFRNMNLHQLFSRTGIQDNIRLTHDKNTNSLLITSSKHNFDILKSILEKIDIPKNQVFIKTIIMDLNAEDDLDWDLNYFSFLEDTKEGSAGLLPRVAFSSKKILDILQEGATGQSTGTILNFGNKDLGETTIEPGAIASMMGAGALSKMGPIKIPSLMAFVNMIKKKANGNILSTPQIIAIDNEKSSISVGSDVPVGQKSQQTGTHVTTSQDREDVSTTLEIIPYINPDGRSVRLQIEQKIDSIDPTTRGPEALAKSSITVTKRSIKTNIILNDQETAVLGGLMNDVETERTRKIPLLGDLPLVGWLFRSKNLEKRKQNLLVFITPKIIKSAGGHQDLLRDKVDEKIHFIKQFMGGKKKIKAQSEKILSQVKLKKNELREDGVQSGSPPPPIKQPESPETSDTQEDLF